MLLVALAPVDPALASGLRACGRGVTIAPTAGEPQVLAVPGLDARARRALVRDIDALTCHGDPRLRARYRRLVDRVRLVEAQGATEPAAYLDGRTLIVEFVGGPFDRRLFRHGLRRALAGAPVVND